jgi:hypothetical protein
LDDPISLDHVRRFLSDYVATYDELDVLLCLLHRRDQDLQASDLARELGISESACRLALEAFCLRRLATRGSDGQAFRFSPATEALTNDVLALARAYHIWPVGVIRAMTENAVQRVRASAARAFPESPREWKAK